MIVKNNTKNGGSHQKYQRSLHDLKSSETENNLRAHNGSSILYFIYVDCRRMKGLMGDSGGLGGDMSLS